MRRVQALLFDLDGLIVDSETGYLLAWQQAARYLGYQLGDEQWSKLRGCSAQQLKDELSLQWGSSTHAAFDMAEFSRISSEFWLAEVRQNGIPVKTGFFQLLERLNQWQIPFALVTNSGHMQAQRVLELADLSGVFKVVVAGDHVSQLKPAPDSYLLAARHLNAEINRCLVLEDSLIGVQAAKAAGARCCYIPSHSVPDAQALQLADWTRANLAEVADALSAGEWLSL